MARDGSDLEYWMYDDQGWKSYQAIDWDSVDTYVEKGWLTEHERDLLHAYGSLMASPATGEGHEKWPEIGEAYDKFNEHIPDANYGGDYDPDKNYFDINSNGSELADDNAPEVAEVPKAPDFGGHAGAGARAREVVVNQEAMRQFAGVAEKLRQIIVESRDLVTKVDVKPGAFSTAYGLRSEVNGKLKSGVETFMTNAAATLFDINETMNKISREYENSEELNKLTAEKLAPEMAELYGSIDNLKSSGNGEAQA
ncbi:hypothetical protein ABT337_09970 [Saccharopolyspora hirsuta]|uniref:Uncharacterized protein n=1 Tax=Saccharopolyspora hirsuta TaxID=1837 RepID=A0A5M7BUS0_SACHI|nr:hypothetical protein [Saccharopolyspora hirsuta]KAA5830115.1 hypothetical protein F1721_23755 [Saccharopolyspora hirsuta]MBF6507434.1 hypothetical protein [Nocardia farcinica]